MRLAHAVCTTLVLGGLPAVALAQEDAGHLDAPFREDAVPTQRVEVGGNLAVGPSVLRTDETESALVSAVGFRVELVVVGRRLGFAAIPFQGRIGLGSGWNAVSARAGPRLRLTPMPSGHEVFLGYDLGLLQVGELVSDELECGELFDCVVEPDRYLGHGLSLTYLHRPPGRRAVAVGAVLEAVLHARERVLFVQLAFVVSPWSRNRAPR